jgi:NADPH-dependent 2,4-dienoyl-CoA reductase/sulfur reductase-like enzyme
MAAYKVLIPQNVAEEGKNYLRDKGYEIKMGSGVTGVTNDETGECMVRLTLHAAQGIAEVLSDRQPTWPVNRLTERR